MDGVVRVNLATVTAVSSFAEQSDDMRRNLYQTVRVEPHADGGAVMVSTDGHILGLGYDPEGSVPEGGYTLTISRETARELKRLAGGHGELPDRWLVFVRGEAVATIENENGCRLAEVAAYALEGSDSEFPGWRKVVPNPNLGELTLCGPHSVRHDILKSLRFGETDSQRKGRNVCFWAKDGKEPYVATYGDRKDIIAVFIPVEGNPVGAKAIPEWVAGTVDVDKAAETPATAKTTEGDTPIEAFAPPKEVAA